MNLEEYSQLLLEKLGQKQVRTNCKELITKIVSKENCQLWALSKDHNEYNNFHHMVDGTLKTTVTTEKINLCLLARQTDYFRSQTYYIIVHDPSCICKPETMAAEYLSQVKGLNNKIVNGYMTYNCVAVDLKSEPIHLLRCVPYSTEQPEYITQKEVKQLKSGYLFDKERVEEIKKLETADKTFNLKSLTFDAIHIISEHIHRLNPDATVIDVFDRYFDDTELFEYETEAGNLFVIRLKLSRNSNELTINSNGKEQKVKLRHQTFFESHEKNYSKIQFRDRTYSNATGIFEWNYLTINKNTYSVLRVRFYDSQGKKIFAEPMLLITNMQVDNEQMAMLVFEIYMTRSKIEGVFKFCKSNLGWENIQIPLFECVKNLLSLVFFVAGYFYEIEDEMTKDPTFIWIALLGGGKGEVTRIYILRGLAMLINYRLAQQYIKEHNISEKQIDEIIKTYKSNT